MPVTDWRALIDLGKSERDYVVKPSGFSELAWGSRGVKIANDLTKDDWTAAIEKALEFVRYDAVHLAALPQEQTLRMPYFDRASEARSKRSTAACDCARTIS